MGNLRGQFHELCSSGAIRGGTPSACVLINPLTFQRQTPWGGATVVKAVSPANGLRLTPSLNHATYLNRSYLALQLHPIHAPIDPISASICIADAIF